MENLKCLIHIVRPSNWVVFFFGLIEIFFVEDLVYIHPVRGHFSHRNGVNTFNLVRFNVVNQVNPITPKIHRIKR